MRSPRLELEREARLQLRAWDERLRFAVAKEKFQQQCARLPNHQSRPRVLADVTFFHRASVQAISFSDCQVKCSRWGIYGLKICSPPGDWYSWKYCSRRSFGIFDWRPREESESSIFQKIWICRFSLKSTTVKLLPGKVLKYHGMVLVLYPTYLPTQTAKIT